MKAVLKFAFLMVCFLVFASAGWALYPCRYTGPTVTVGTSTTVGGTTVGPSIIKTNGNYFYIPTALNYSNPSGGSSGTVVYSLQTACGIYDLDNSTRNLDNQQLHFLYHTADQTLPDGTVVTGKLVQLMTFDLYNATNGSGLDDGEWWVKVTYPFLNNLTADYGRITEGSWKNYNLDTVKKAAGRVGVGCVGGGAIGLAVGAFIPGPHVIATGFVGCLVGGLIGAGSALDQTAKIDTSLSSVTFDQKTHALGPSLGRLVVELDSDSEWKAQVDKFELQLNKDALDIIEAVYALPEDKVVAKYGSYENFFYLIGTALKAENIGKAFKVAATQSPPPEAAAVKQEFAPLMQQVQAALLDEKPLDVYREDFDSFSVDEKETMTKVFADIGYTGDPIQNIVDYAKIEVFRKNSKEGLEPKNWTRVPDKWDGHKLRIQPVNYGDDLKIDMYVPKNHKTTGQPVYESNIVSFQVKGIDAPANPTDPQYLTKD